MARVCRFGTRENIFRLMMTGLGKVASKAFGPGIPEILEIDLGKTKGSKPRMAGTIGVPFWINPRDGSTIVGKAKTKGVKPSMVGMACPFFGAGALESTSDSMISLITTEVGGVGILILRGTL